MIYCDCESTEFINLKNEKYLNEYKFVFKCDYKSKMFFISFWLLLIMNEIFLLIADSAHLGEKKKNIIKKKKNKQKNGEDAKEYTKNDAQYVIFASVIGFCKYTLVLLLTVIY